MSAFYLDKMTLTIIGIGQSLRGDDGAGLAAVRRWQEMCPAQHPDVRIELAESPGLGLLNLLEGAAAAILVDAVRSGAIPGSLHCLDESDIAAFLDGANSAHGWGVAESLALSRQLDPDSLPARLVLIGIEAGQVKLGEGLSPAVAASLPDAARLIQETIQQL